MIAGADDYIRKLTDPTALPRTSEGGPPPRWSFLMEQTPFASSELLSTDPAALDRLRRFGGVKLLREMIALFLTAAPERLAVVRNGLVTGDADAVERALHSLKSSSAQLGAMRMQRLSEQGEHRARERSMEGVAQLADELDMELTRVRAWLTTASTEGTT